MQMSACISTNAKIKLGSKDEVGHHIKSKN